MAETAAPNHAEEASRPPRPTLKTIAYMTGLGITTVSRALNDAPDIGSETKKRVRLVADQIGYRPNRAGVRLRTGKTNVISLVLGLDEDVLGLTSQLVLGVSETLAGSSYHLVITPQDRTRDPMDPVRYVVETESADGIIFSATRENDPRVQYLMDRGFPMVSHGRTGTEMAHPFVDFDNAAYARLGVERLHARGRSRIALLAPPPELYYAHHMTQGFVAAMAAYDLLEVPMRAASLDQPLDVIKAEVERAMASRHRPDGIICGNGSSALTAAVAIENAGLKIGKDVDLVAKHSEKVIRLVRPEIFVVNEDFRRAGVLLARSLIAAIDGADPRSLQFVDVPG